MSTRIRVNMKPVNTILSRLGVDRNGDVQRFVTETVNLRITRYMPYRTGALIKNRYIKSPTEIEVVGKYATYQYYGELMVDHITGSAYSPKYGWKVRTGIPLKYHRPGVGGENGNGNPNAGPFWDRALMSHEKDAIIADIQEYVDRKAGKR